MSAAPAPAPPPPPRRAAPGLAPGAPCPVQAAVDAVGGKWKPGILYRLQDGPLRLSEMRRAMPWISERVLIRQVQELVAAGLVARTDQGGRPPRTDYGLSPHGESLRPLLDEMARWGALHAARGAGA